MALIDFLRLSGFSINDDDAFELADLRICTSTEGVVTLYRFEGYELSWQVEFSSSTPDAVIIAAINAAM